MLSYFRLQISERSWIIFLIPVFVLGPFTASTLAWPVDSYKELRYEHVRGQNTLSSCGTAALATLFSEFYGTEVSEEEIIELIKPYLEEEIEQLKEGKLPEGGVSMLDLKKVSRELGVPTRGYRIPKEKILAVMNKLRAPLLVHLDKPEDHFVLSFTGRRRKLILADPSWGVRPISKEEFFSRWDGLVLAFAPDSNYVDRARKVVDEISDHVEQRNLTGSLSRSLAWEY